jgi:hypothetical protein
MAIEDTVNGIITDARSYSQELFDEANDLVTQAVRNADNFGSFSTPNLVFDSGSLPDITLSDLTAPTLNFARSPLPTMGALQGVAVPTVPTLPEAPAELDTAELFQHNAPAFDTGELAVDAPDVNTVFTIPSAPDVNTPDAPDSIQVLLGDTPDVVLPSFTAELQDGRLASAEDLEAKFETALQRMTPQMRDFVEEQASRFLSTYAPDHKAGLAKLEGRISTEMDEGVMGSEIEQQIFDRARSRIEAERATAFDRVRAEVSRAGFPIPPGLLQGALVRLEVEALRATVAAAAETSIERTKIEIQHGQFLMNLSAQMRQQTMSQVVQYVGALLQANAQALDYSRQVVQAGVDSYNLSVQQLRANLELYQTEAGVWETRLKAAMAELDLHKVELEAAKAKKDIEIVDIQAYEARIRGEAQKVQTYLAQLEGVSTQANVERTKVELYGEQVKAYATRVGAKEAEFRAYAAAISGDQARVEAYAKTVDAYRGRVQGVQAVVDAESSVAEVGLKNNRNLIDVYRAELAGYAADIDAAKAEAGVNAESFRAAVSAYQASLQGQLAQQQSQLSQSEQTLRATSTSYDGSLRAQIARADLNKEKIRLQTSATLDAAKVLQSTAQAALSSQNTMVQLYAENV